MLHVTDALLSLGTLQVAERSCWNEREKEKERSRGQGRSEGLDEEGVLSLAGQRDAGRWRTTGSHAGGKGLQKSTEALLGIFQSDLGVTSPPLSRRVPFYGGLWFRVRAIFFQIVVKTL